MMIHRVGERTGEEVWIRYGLQCFWNLWEYEFNLHLRIKNKKDVLVIQACEYRAQPLL